MTACFKGWAEADGNKAGRCCCNCQFQRPISAHPWNKNELTKGSISNIIGYGCTMPEMPSITFFDFEHSMCEMHEFKNPTYQVKREENV